MIIEKFNDFEDVQGKENAWWYGPLKRAWQEGRISGYPDGTIGPNQVTTRAESVSLDDKSREYENIIERARIPKLVAEITPAIVVIRHEYTDSEGQKRTSIGTGEFINSNGYVLTNNHCIMNLESKEINIDNVTIGVMHKEQSEGNSDIIKYYGCELIANDDWKDLAVVKIKDYQNNSYLPVLNKELEMGHEVISYGHGGAYLYAVGHGLIAQDYQIVGLFGYGQTDANINPGNSGGIISSVYKKAIAGVPARKDTRHDNLNFFIPPLEIHRFFTNNNIQYEKV